MTMITERPTQRDTRRLLKLRNYLDHQKRRKTRPCCKATSATDYPFAHLALSLLGFGGQVSVPVLPPFFSVLDDKSSSLDRQVVGKRTTNSPSKNEENKGQGGNKTREKEIERTTADSDAIPSIIPSYNTRPKPSVLCSIHLLSDSSFRLSRGDVVLVGGHHDIGSS